MAQHDPRKTIAERIQDTNTRTKTKEPRQRLHPTLPSDKVRHNHSNNLHQYDKMHYPICRSNPQPNGTTNKVTQRKTPNKTHQKSIKKGDRLINKINLMTINVRGIKSKINSIETAMISTNSHITGITETLLREGENPKIDGYTWIGKPRGNHSKGGGIGFYIRNDILSKIEIIDTKKTETEIRWIRTKSKPPTAIAIYYGKQENAKVREITQEYENIQKDMDGIPPKDIIIMGDFNAKIQINRENYTQTQSRNGKLLTKLMIKNNLTPNTNLDLHTGTWTRINNGNTNEKAVLDYILVSNSLTSKITQSHTDTSNAMAIKGKNITDHRAVTMSIEITTKHTPKIIHRWKKGSPPEWDLFNKEIANQLIMDDTPDKTYTNLNKAIIQALRNNIGKVKIDTNRKRKISNNEIQRCKKDKKLAKRDYNLACKTKNAKLIKEKMDKLRICQQKHQEAIHNTIADQTTKEIDELISKGGANSNTFWDIRHKLTKVAPQAYHLITEEGSKITDKERAKEYIAEYFEQLYQAREGDHSNKEWTETIERTVKKINTKTQNPTNNDYITLNEVNAAIKRLKKGKSVGPDDIPNEALIAANTHTRKIITAAFNQIYSSEYIPKEWKEGEVIRIYKGKGTKGKCSNERGITLSSNMGKLFERIINKRIQNEIEMTPSQGGGQAHKSTVDHLIKLNNCITKSISKKQTLYITFLDVTKAYDKAWGKAVIYTLNKSGVSDKLCRISQEINTDLTARIQTQHGLTRPIKIKDSIRQGGILSVIQYANMMDDITKEIQKDIDNEIIIGRQLMPGCLLWMDDVVLIHNDANAMQKMLDTTYEVANRYRIVFGKSKSKILQIGQRDNLAPFKLGDMQLEHTDSYKYLGVKINAQGSMEDQIKEIVGKVEVATQTIINISENKKLKSIQMETLWKLHNACITPLITYGSEALTIKANEKKSLERIYNNSIKRLLCMPNSAPTTATLWETGLDSITEIIDRLQIQYLAKLTKDTNLRQVENTKWLKNMEKKLSTYNMEEDQLEEMTKTKIKHKFKINNTKRKQETTRTTKTQLPGRLTNNFSRPKYMNKMTRKECSTIFKYKAKMMKIKANYPNKKIPSTCRWCDNTNETQEHIIEECKEFTALTQNLNTHSITYTNNANKSSEAYWLDKINEKLKEREDDLIPPPKRTQTTNQT